VSHEQTAATQWTIAWLITAVYYFFQYSLRSAPSVMMPELGTAFGLSATAVASLAGLFYYGYSPFSLVAGVGMDRLGPRKVVPLGAATVGIGALLFATGAPRRPASAASCRARAACSRWWARPTSR
jgi:sugar phosphate permease